MKRAGMVLIVICGAATAAVLAGPVLAQRAPTSGPIARYDMRAGTISGTGAMGGGAGAALGMMFGRGGGNAAQHELHLRLGSSQTPTRGAAKADHFMPPTARLGKSVQLISPREEREPVDALPGERPTGRLLVFWGCGERAPRGQPVVIDFGRLAAGQVPPGLWSSTIVRDWGPTPANSRTFARWPAEDGKYAKPDSSLIGTHRVAGNYAPEIQFALSKDFMAPLRVTQVQNASGSTALSWGALADATGYLATMFGGKMGPGGTQGDMVMWSSSASRQFGGGLADWLTPAQAAALVKDRTLLPPATTTCTVPAEVRAAAPDFRMGMMTAFGPQEDFAYPPRPADARAPWNVEWTVRVRHRSTTSWMDMPGMAAAGQAADGQPAPQPDCRKRGGIGGILGSVIKPGC